MTPTRKKLEAAIHEGTRVVRDIILSGESNSVSTLIESGLKFRSVWQMENEPLYLVYWVESIRGLLSSDYHSAETIEYFASIGIEA
jgi:hypothetical protein